MATKKAVAKKTAGRNADKFDDDRLPYCDEITDAVLREAASYGLKFLIGSIPVKRRVLQQVADPDEALVVYRRPFASTPDAPKERKFSVE